MSTHQLEIKARVQQMSELPFITWF